jgi:nitroreductase
MSVTEALATRLTCRSFLATPVPGQTVRAILEGATRAPSGGNLQPQHVWVLTGARLTTLVDTVVAKVRAGQFGDGVVDYAVFPPLLKEPYGTRRWQVGADMYAAIGVTRLDVEGIAAHLEANFRFFGAPVGLFFAIDRDMQQGQWSDLGMYVMAVMLLAREHGLHTAALESWALWPRTVAAHLGMPDELMLFCGMALGHMDEAAPINRWRARRAALHEFARIEGFGD